MKLLAIIAIICLGVEFIITLGSISKIEQNKPGPIIASAILLTLTGVPFVYVFLTALGFGIK